MSQPTHTKLCQCEKCLARRWDEYKDRIDTYAKKGVVPHSVDQTVMVKQYTVRPHFRRNPNHLGKDEGLRGMVESYLKKVLKRSVAKAAKP